MCVYSAYSAAALTNDRPKLMGVCQSDCFKNRAENLQLISLICHFVNPGVTDW